VDYVCIYIFNYLVIINVDKKEVLTMGFCTKNVGKYGDQMYFVFRVFVGLLFTQHGAQKLFGWFGGVAGDSVAVPLVSLMGLAGVIEFFGGLAIAFGFFTRLVATAAALEMIVAFFMVHVKQGWIPFLNQGELALLYFASFLALIVLGNKKWNLEQALLKKEVF